MQSAEYLIALPNAEELYSQVFKNRKDYDCQECLRDFETEGQDWFESDQDYLDLIHLCYSVMENLPLYSCDGCEYIQLSDNRTELEFSYDQREFFRNQEFVFIKNGLLNTMCKMFQEKTGESLLLLGRSGRHACVVNNLKNAVQLEYLKHIQQQYETEYIGALGEFMDGWNSYDGE